MTSRHLVYLLLLCAVLGGAGCARAARDTSGFALHDEAVVDAPFEQAWQAAKAALRERELNLYTRDKRGTFIAFSEMKRSMGLFTPHRAKYTVALEPVSNNATRVKVETVNQVYGVTLLTYPDWHDRKAETNEVAVAILDAIRSKVAGTPVTPPSSEASVQEASPETMPGLGEGAPSDGAPSEEPAPVQAEDLEPVAPSLPAETPGAPVEPEPSPEPTAVE